MKEPTDILVDLITSNCGTYGIDCGFCSVTWFTRNAEDYEELQAKAKAEPAKYRESSDDGLAFGWLDGRQVVYGCCREKMERYAEWLWSHRELIAAYLKRRAQEELQEAQRNLETVS